MLNQSLQGKVHKKQTQMKKTHERKGHEREFTPGESVYVKNFGPGLKWLIGTIIHVTSSVSYAEALQDGKECRRHVDHLRSRRADTDSVIPLCQREQVDTDTETTPPNCPTVRFGSTEQTDGSRCIDTRCINTRIENVESYITWDRETAPEAKTNTMRFKEESKPDVPHSPSTASSSRVTLEHA